MGHNLQARKKTLNKIPCEKKGKIWVFFKKANYINMIEILD